MTEHNCGSEEFWIVLLWIEEMIFRFMSFALLLSNTVLGNACRKTFTISPGNITRLTQPLKTSSDHPGITSLPAYCDFILRAPSSSYYIEVNFTQSNYRLNELHKLDDIRPDETNAQPRDSPFSSLSQQQKTSLLPADNEAFLADGEPEVECLPNVAVVEVTLDGLEELQRRICLEPNNVNNLPVGFRSKTHVLRLHYSWDPGQTTGVSLSFVFHKWPSACRPGEFACYDGSCLPDTSLVCNTVADCLDQSDEHNCMFHSNDGDKHFMEVIVIMIVIVFTLGVLTGVIVHYRLTTRMWREHHPESTSTDHHHLNPHHSHTTEVMYVPGMPLDHTEQEVALQRVRLHGITIDTELNLPPRIRRSKDGEEGYLNSQQFRQISLFENGRRESIRPPPNRTAHQGDSPPHFRSNSVSKTDSGGNPVSRRGAHLAPTTQNSKIASNSPSIARCDALSCDAKGPYCYSSPLGCHTVHHTSHSSPLMCKQVTRLHCVSTTTLPRQSQTETTPSVSTAILKSQVCSHSLCQAAANSYATSSHRNCDNGGHGCSPHQCCSDHSNPQSLGGSTTANGQLLATKQATQSDSKV